MIRPDKVKTAGKLRNEGENMFWRILKRDMKRKRTMNVILLLFILLASMFLSSSINNLTTITGTVNQFIEISKVPDLFLMALAQGEEDPVLDFLEKSESVRAYEEQDTLNINNDQVEILYREDEAQAEKKSYEKTNTLSLQAVPESYMKVFDEEGEEITLHAGEIAVAKLEAEQNHLQEGDRLAITIGDVRREFTVVTQTRDAVFGTSFMGFKRNLISQEDFDAFMDQDGLTITRIYNVDYADSKEFQKSYQEQQLSVISGIEKDLIPMCYVFDMLVAGVMIIVSICLILISFLVMRFTISFTLQEDSKEIGIMKAIGLKDREVSRVYLVKYLALAVIGATAGFFLGIPFGALMQKYAVINVVVTVGNGNLLINLLASAMVVGIVLLFCVRCMAKMKRISAIEAIRGGSTGERFSAKHMNLSAHKRLSVPEFLALNDVVNQKRRFVVLLCSFIIGTAMLLLPIYAKTTLEGEDIVYSFGFWKSDLYMESEQERLVSMGEEGIREAEDSLQELKEVLKQENISAQTGMLAGYNLKAHAEAAEDSVVCQTTHPIGEWEQHLVILEGREPVHENEIAVTEVTAEKMRVEIGDTLYLPHEDGDRAYLITGTYQTMMNMGEGMWLPKTAKPDASYLAGMLAFQIVLENPEKLSAAVEVLEREYPDAKIYQGKQYMDSMFGLDSIISALNGTVAVILALVLGINALLTVLMVRTFLAKERGDIALMKSMGFRSWSIKRWQSGRILLVLAAAILIGTVLSRVLVPVTVQPIFALMGATKMKLTVNPLLSYLLCPLLMLVVTAAAAVLSTGGIRGIDVKEVNNIE